MAEIRGEIAVIGAGTMGRGIAQVAGEAGFFVRLYDANTGAAEQASDFVIKMLERKVEKGALSDAQLDLLRNNFSVAAELSELKNSTIVIEAIIENLEAKLDLFRQLESIVSKDAILASNTSSLSITRIAAACKNPERVAGLHFFNPVPLMKVVEVIGGARTAGHVSRALENFVRATGHTPIVATDTPGFIVNHLGRGLYTEGLRIVQEGVTSVSTIDTILRECAGFRMGPFELLDLTGLDVSFQVMEQIYRQYYEEPRFRPSPLAARQIAAGLFGRKTNQGFYEYRDNKKVETEPALAPIKPEYLNYWLASSDKAVRNSLGAAIESAGGRVNNADRPDTNDVCVIFPLGNDATTEALEQELNPALTVAIDPVFFSDKFYTSMTSPSTSRKAVESLAALLAKAGCRNIIIHDSPGFVAQRVVATIVNIACDAAQQGVGTPKDIDAGAKLGLGYPIGPLAWGDRISASTILGILERLQALTGDPRYRPSPWLRRRAQLSLSLLHIAEV